MNTKRVLNIDGIRAEELVRTHLKKLVDQSVELLRQIPMDEDNPSDKSAHQHLQSFMQSADWKLYWVDFKSNDRVILFTSGTGKVWPRGAHVRSGTVMKEGHTEDSKLVMLDEPIGDDKVVNVWLWELTLYDDSREMFSAMMGDHQTGIDKSSSACCRWNSCRHRR